MYLYEIRNIKNNKCYIGQTISKNPKKRWFYHRWTLNKGIHINSHLQNAWNKYGEKSFTWSIISQCNSIDELNKVESETIIKLRSKNLVYNITNGGDNCYHTEETKNKLRQLSAVSEYHQLHKRILPPLISPTGEIISGVIGLSEFCKNNNLHRGKFRHVLDGKSNSHRGWKLQTPHLKTIQQSNRSRKSGYKQNRIKIVETQKNYTIIDPNGNTYVSNNLKQFCRENNLPYQSMTFLRRTGTNKSKNLKNWRIHVN